MSGPRRPSRRREGGRVRADGYSLGSTIPIWRRTSSIVCITESVSSQVSSGDSVRPSATQRASSAASNANPPPRATYRAGIGHHRLAAQRRVGQGARKEERAGQFHPPGRTGDGGRRRGLAEHCRIQHGMSAPGGEQHGHLGVHASRCRLADRDDPLRSADCQRRERHGVHTKVEQRTPSQIGAEHPVRRVEVEVLPVVGQHSRQLAQPATGQQLANDVRLWLESRPHRLHHEHAGGASCVDHLRSLGCVARERLFDQHMLSCCDRQQRVGAVLTVW